MITDPAAIDLVKRLRHRDLNCSPEDYHREVVGRAADEIESLRTALVEQLEGRKEDIDEIMALKTALKNLQAGSVSAPTPEGSESG